MLLGVLTPAPAAPKMVEVPIALVIVLPSVVIVENRVSVEMGVEEPLSPPPEPEPEPEAPEPDAEAPEPDPPEPDAPEPEAPEPVAPGPDAPEPEAPTPPAPAVGLALAPVMPEAEPAAPVAVPAAVKAEVAERVPELDAEAAAVSNQDVSQKRTSSYLNTHPQHSSSSQIE